VSFFFRRGFKGEVHFHFVLRWSRLYPTHQGGKQNLIDHPSKRGEGLLKGKTVFSFNNEGGKKLSQQELSGRKRGEKKGEASVVQGKTPSLLFYGKGGEKKNAARREGFCTEKRREGERRKSDTSSR